MASATGPWLLLTASLVAGCGTTGSYDVPAVPDGGIGSSKAAACSQTFATNLSGAYGRLDGTVTAIVEPTDTQCPSATKNTLILELSVLNGTLEVALDASNTQSTTSNSDWYLASITHAPLTAWAEGWHPGGNLDYPGDLGAHSSDPTWQDLKPADLIKKLDDLIPLNTRVSVYATNAGGDETTVHLVHFQGNQQDGAILIDPGGTNTWLLLRPDDLTF